MIVMAGGGFYILDIYGEETMFDGKGNITVTLLKSR